MAEAVHPHACGENFRHRSRFRLQIRFTPTPVGKTGKPVMIFTGAAVHPHACGENFCCTGMPSDRRGSPPRLWGKLSPPFALPPPDSVHPHACGENVWQAQQRPAIVGSPPRLWGKHRASAFLIASSRFTPTPVGKTACRMGGRNGDAVHPHACGENAPMRYQHCHRFGSPPRLWGKHNENLLEVRFRRFTPTPVGKTRLADTYGLTLAVHPHACGENAR